MDGGPTPADGRRSSAPPDAPDPALSDLRRWTARCYGVLSSLRSTLFSPPELVETLPRLQICDGSICRSALSREQELALLELLDNVLNQVQTCVKSLDQEPVTENDLGNVFNIPGNPVLMPQDSHNMWSKFTWSEPPITKTDDDLAKIGELNQKLVKLVDEFSLSVKAMVSAEVSKGGVSPEFAPQLLKRIDLLSRNCQVAVKSASSNYSISGLRGRLTLPDSMNTLYNSLMQYGYKIQEVTTIAQYLMDNAGTSPGYFSSIGKEAIALLTEDFTFRTMTLNSDPFEKISFGLGSENSGAISRHQFLMKLKGENLSFFFSGKSVINYDDDNDAANADGDNDAGLVTQNLDVDNADAVDPIVLAIQNAKPDKPIEAVPVIQNPNTDNADAKPDNNAIAAVPNVDNDAVSVKLAIDKIYWNNLKGVLLCPFPSLHGKIELKSLNPYYSCAGSIGLPWKPKMDLAFVMGVKSACIGFKFSFDFQRWASSFGVGVRVTHGLEAYGFNFKEPATYRATICKKILDSTTTVAGVLSYSPVEGDEHGPRLTLGLKHAIDPSFYVKARAGSAGLSLALKKSFCAGKCTVKAASHVDITDPWRRPKFGIVFSVRS